MEKIVIVVKDGKVTEIASDGGIVLAVVAYQTEGVIEETEAGTIDGKPAQILPRLVRPDAQRSIELFAEILGEDN